jgi:hypothetical protein
VVNPEEQQGDGGLARGGKRRRTERMCPVRRSPMTSLAPPNQKNHADPRAKRAGAVKLGSVVFAVDSSHRRHLLSPAPSRRCRNAECSKAMEEIGRVGGRAAGSGLTLEGSGRVARVKARSGRRAR